MKITLVTLAFVFATPCLAQVVVPTRTVRADAIITEMDVMIGNGSNDDGFDLLRDVIGQEAKVVLYAGRPILVDQIGSPAIVDRNQIVSLLFEGRGLRIATEARALERGGVGDNIRVMNLASRATLFGQVQPDGTIQIKQ